MLRIENLRLYDRRLFMTQEQEIRTLAGIKEATHKMISDVDHVGIEVEVENITNPGFRHPLWSAKEDGSLRNNGMEYISKPIRSNMIPHALNQLNLLLNKFNPEHDFSIRTSVHVHVNILDLPMEGLLTMLLVYQASEQLLYRFCGRARDKGIFCVPLQKTDMYVSISSILEAIGGDKKEITPDNLYTFNRTCDRWRKYCGLNLKTVNTYGTVEFRQMPGTMDVDKLVTWINMLLSIKKYAQEVPYEKVKERLLQMNTVSDYDAFLQEVYGNLFSTLRYSQYHKAMSENVTYIKECFAKGFKPTPAFNTSNFYNSWIAGTPKKEKKKRVVGSTPPVVLGEIPPPPPPRVDNDLLEVVRNIRERAAVHPNAVPHRPRGNPFNI